MDKIKNEKMTVEYEVDGQNVKLSPIIVRDYITNGVPLSDAEYKMFVEIAKVRKLNPFLGEVYAIKFSKDHPAQIVVGKDAILKRAIQHPQFNGREQGIIVLKEDGSVEERRGTFKLANEKLVGGWAKAYRKDWEHPTYISVAFDEVAQRKKNGELNRNWATKGATMVEKVALVRALRETFTEDLGGMIDQDEAWEQSSLNQTQTYQPEEEHKEVIKQEEPDNVVEAEFSEQQVSIEDL